MDFLNDSCVHITVLVWVVDDLQHPLEDYRTFQIDLTSAYGHCRIVLLLSEDVKADESFGASGLDYLRVIQHWVQDDCRRLEGVVLGKLNVELDDFPLVRA